MLFFKHLYKQLRNYLEKKDIRWGISGSREYFIRDEEKNRMFLYDFTIPKYTFGQTFEIYAYTEDINHGIMLISIK